MIAIEEKKERPWRLRDEIAFAWMSDNRSAHIHIKTIVTKVPYKEPKLPKR